MSGMNGMESSTNESSGMEWSGIEWSDRVEWNGESSSGVFESMIE